MSKIRWIFAAIMLVGLASWAFADRLTLKDGTVLEGTVIKKSEGYWIKTPNGETRTVAESDVAKFEKTAPPEASAPPAPVNPLNGAGRSDQASPATHPSRSMAEARAAYSQARSKSESLANPATAVVIWQKFIDDFPDFSGLNAARQELARWAALAKDGSQKVNGKWMTGAEIKTMLEQAEKLADEGWKLALSHQTLKAIPKLQEADKVFPNSLRLKLVLGNLMLDERRMDDAGGYYESALRLQPDWQDALNNLAIVQAEKKQWDAAMESLCKAAQVRDSKIVAQNLVTLVSGLPPEARHGTAFNQAKSTGELLANEFQIAGPIPGWDMCAARPGPLNDNSDALNGQTPPNGMQLWSGSGFMITVDGLILTNRHVVEGGSNILVLTATGQQSAEIVVIDHEQDLALIRIKGSPKTPLLQLGGADIPPDGADCVVMGYPLVDRLGADVKVTRGIVSSSQTTANGADVLVDAKVNPGNSGGPMLDKNGNVMAIVCMKSLASASEESMGMGIGAGHIRRFLERNHIATTPGPAAPAPLSTEDIVAKAKSATVCILVTK